MLNPNGASVTTSSVQIQKLLDSRKEEVIKEKIPRNCWGYSQGFFLHNSKLCSFIPLPSPQNLILLNPYCKDPRPECMFKSQTRIRNLFSVGYIPFCHWQDTFQIQSQRWIEVKHSWISKTVFQQYKILRLKRFPLHIKMKNKLPRTGMGFLPQATQYTDQNKLRTFWGRNSENPVQAVPVCFIKYPLQQKLKRNLAISGHPKPSQYPSSWFGQKSHPM